MKNVSIAIAGKVEEPNYAFTVLHRIFPGTEKTKHFSIEWKTNQHGLDICTFEIDKEQLYKFEENYTFIIFVDDKPISIGYIINIDTSDKYKVRVEVNGFQHKLDEITQFRNPNFNIPSLPSAYVTAYILENTEFFGSAFTILIESDYIDIPLDILVKTYRPISLQNYKQMLDIFINILTDMSGENPDGIMRCVWDIVPFEKYDAFYQKPFVYALLRFYPLISSGPVPENINNTQRATLFVDYDFKNYDLEGTTTETYNTIKLYDKINGVNTLVSELEDPKSVDIYGHKPLEVVLMGLGFNSPIITKLKQNLLDTVKEERTRITLNNIDKILTDNIATWDAGQYDIFLSLSRYNISLEKEGTDIVVSDFTDITEWDLTQGSALGYGSFLRAPVNRYRSYAFEGNPTNNKIIKVLDEPLLNPLKFGLYFNKVVGGSVIIVAFDQNDNQDLLVLSINDASYNLWQKKERTTYLTNIVKFEIYFIGDVQLDRLYVTTNNPIYIKDVILKEQNFTYTNKLLCSCTFDSGQDTLSDVVEKFSRKGNAAFDNIFTGVV